MSTMNKKSTFYCLTYTHEDIQADRDFGFSTFQILYHLYKINIQVCMKHCFIHNL